MNSKLENLDGSMKKVTEKLAKVITKDDGSSMRIYEKFILRDER